MSSSFSLVPFDRTAMDFALGITAHVVREFDQRLCVHFEIADPQNQILWPAEPASPKKSGSSEMRRHELWRETCFEIFAKPKSHENYWEMNMALSGQWNVYAFERYRDPVPPREESSVHSLEFTASPQKLSVVLPAFRNEPFSLGISAVIRTKDSKTSYWALKHADDKPDFHRAESFVILSEGV